MNTISRSLLAVGILLALPTLALTQTLFEDPSAPANPPTQTKLPATPAAPAGPSLFEDSSVPSTKPAQPVSPAVVPGGPTLFADPADPLGMGQPTLSQPTTPSKAKIPAARQSPRLTGPTVGPAAFPMISPFGKRLEPRPKGYGSLARPPLNEALSEPKDPSTAPFRGRVGFRVAAPRTPVASGALQPSPANWIALARTPTPEDAKRVMKGRDTELHFSVGPVRIRRTENKLGDVNMWLTTLEFGPAKGKGLEVHMGTADGKLFAERVMLDGKEIRKRFFNNKNGKIVSEDVSGEFSRTWDPQGRLTRVTSYKAPAWNRIYKEGRLVKEHMLDAKGFRHGMEVIWNAKGGPACEMPFTHGKADGLQRRWDSAGWVSEETQFDNGRSVYFRHYHPTGYARWDQTRTIIRTSVRTHTLYSWNDKGELTKAWPRR